MVRLDAVCHFVLSAEGSAKRCCRKSAKCKGWRNKLVGASMPIGVVFL